VAALARERDELREEMRRLRRSGEVRLQGRGGVASVVVGGRGEGGSRSRIFYFCWVGRSGGILASVVGGGGVTLGGACGGSEASARRVRRAARAGGGQQTF
jgi:hypothetical protein